MEEQQHQKRQRSHQAEAAPPPRVPCARCRSDDTKFCYYNNYNTSQPRYYCRTCKRHWTHGGSLRNVPEGGSSSKKNHSRSRKLSPSPSSAAVLKLPEQPQMLHASHAIAGAAGVLGAPLAPPASFFYNGSGGSAAGLAGGELSAFQIPGGVLPGEFHRHRAPLPEAAGLNPLDWISLQRLVQQPRSSLTMQHQNLLLFQQLQQQQQRQQQGNAATPATADRHQIRHQSNNKMVFNMASSTPQPRPPPP